MSINLRIRRRSAKHIPDPSKAQYEAMKRLFRDGVRVFVEQIAFDISQYKGDKATGMTISSILSVAKAVQRKTIVASYIHGYGPKRPGHRDLYGYNVPSMNINDYKSKALGERLGRKAYKLDLGSVDNPKYHFKFEIVVLQHLIWEPKWDTVDRAYQEMNTFIQSNWPLYVLDLGEWLINGKLVFRK